MGESRLNPKLQVDHSLLCLFMHLLIAPLAHVPSFLAYEADGRFERREPRRKERRPGETQKVCDRRMRRHLRGRVVMIDSRVVVFAFPALGL